MSSPIPQPLPIPPLEAFKERAGYESTQPIQAGDEYGRVVQRNEVRTTICNNIAQAYVAAASEMWSSYDALNEEADPYLFQLSVINNWDKVTNNFTIPLPPTITEMAQKSPNYSGGGLWAPGPLP